MWAASSVAHRELQRLESGREQIFARFTQQQMDMFRHDNVTDDVEPIAAMHLLQRILKKIPLKGLSR